MPATIITKTIMPTVTMWPDIETAITFIRYNGTIEIRQGEDKIVLDEDDVENFVKALRMASKLSYEAGRKKE